MDLSKSSREIDLHDIQITDSFWNGKMELIRKTVIPYQWDILNDKVPEAVPSYCMHNFKVAGRMNKEKRDKGDAYVAPTYTFRGFESLPKDPKNPKDDEFYGFVFQDSDFSKWIEAVGYSLINHPDPELEKVADEAIDIVCDAQLDNGYLDTYYIINGMDKAFTNLRDHHELYCFGHLTEGAVSYYKATGKRKLLDAACRFADYIDSYFGPEEGKCKGYPGHEIAEMALVRLYEVTGNKKYLDLSAFFLDERGRKPYYYDKEFNIENRKEGELDYYYLQAHLPVREQSQATGHAVRAVYLYSGMADMARLSGDDSMYEACLRLWNSITNEQMYITGGIGSTVLGEAFSYPFDLPNDSAYAETCASIGLIFFAIRMLQIKPDSKYADVMELALYNTVLSGMSADGKSFFYVNPLEANPKASLLDERKRHVKTTRQKWFGCACCPPNLARLISSLGRYAYTVSDDTLFVHLYIGGVISTTISGSDVEVTVTSDVPNSGNVGLSLKCDHEFEGTLALRIPGWAGGSYRDPVIDGMNTRREDGYLYITGKFRNGYSIKLDFRMEPRVIEADSRVREDEGKVALLRGPVVYCLEEVDNGKDLHLLRMRVEKGFEEVHSMLNGMQTVILKCYGKRRIPFDGSMNDTSKSGLYHTYTKPQYKDVTLKFIPYFEWANRGEGEMSVYIAPAT